jgi:hypothetical protein
MARITTARTMATTARTTGKDNNNNSKEDDSKDNSDNGKDDNNDGGNGNSGGSGGGKIGGEVGGEVSGLVGGKVGSKVGCCSSPLIAWCLHAIGIIQICLGINLFWPKFYLALPDMPNRIYSIHICSRFILCLFWSKSESKPFRPISVVTHRLK